ncbi:MAG: RnfABCDGE type electron transport complex subunit D [Planctomycetota bacterium]|nr:RnfABCDGE type electron transport complex subunit D [Planctomycetota bacterium]
MPQTPPPDFFEDSAGGPPGAPPGKEPPSASPQRPATPVSGPFADHVNINPTGFSPLQRTTAEPAIPSPAAPSSTRPPPTPNPRPAVATIPPAVDRANAESLDMAAAGLAEPMIPGPPWLGPRIRRRQIDLHWLFVAVLMLGSGLAFFGWRAAAQAGVAIGVALAFYILGSLLVRLIRRREPVDRPLYALNSALLLGACLPAGESLTLSVIAGGMLGVLIHLVGRSHRIRIHPVAAALLFAWVAPCLTTSHDLRSLELLVQHRPQPAVLRPERVVVGDLQDLAPTNHSQPWWVADDGPKHDALRRHEPATLLVRESRQVLRHDWFLGRMLASGELCRLEEVLLGSIPGRIGATSRALLMLLGLYLMFRRLSYWPMIASAIGAALAVLLILPIPGEPHLTPVAARLVQLPVLAIITFVAYMLLASPLLLLTLILAPSTAPTSHAGRVVYGIILGGVLMMTQWWPAPQAEFLALALAGVLSRPLDGLQRQGLGPG